MADEDARLSKEVIASVRKEAVGTATKWAVGAGVALLAIAASGWILYLKNATETHFKTLVSSIPAGAVVAFDGPCPAPEWGEYTQAAGRGIIGAGKGVSLKEERVFGQFYGAESVTLTLNHLPTHQHETTSPGHPYAIWGRGPIRENITESGFVTFQTSLTSPIGRDQPVAIETVSPSITLRYCRKNK